jgi:hypothetical protein
MEQLLIILGIAWEIFELLCVVFVVMAFSGGLKKFNEELDAEEKEIARFKPVDESGLPNLPMQPIKVVTVENNEGKYMMYELSNSAFIAQGNTYNDLWEAAEDRYPNITMILDRPPEEADTRTNG